MVYTPFMREWKKRHKPPLNDDLSGRFHDLAGIDDASLPALEDLGFSETIDVPPACEAVAQGRLNYFTGGPIYDYSEARNALMPEPFADDTLGGTSVLSPYFRLGMLSPRQAYWAARAAYENAEGRAARESVEAWVNELAWREFYMHVMYHWPHVSQHSFNREYDALEWRNAPDDLAAWQEGRTGYPLVDAAMRQLNHIGWMPNRARMVVASFLTKDLLIDWRAGERYFMQHLIDGDPAANNGGWQWSAGTGTDAQPYFRIFNPVTQSQKFDPEGTYIRHWVPELRDVTGKHIHAPWKLKEPPADYPAPIVDHKAARQRTLDAFKAVKNS
jgi:deoxyribodipyrimidine photo-lyase